jgi:DNA ligase (NAD+)
MDIEGFGERLAQLFVDHGLLQDFADLYYLQREDVLKVPGFADKSTEKLLAAIESSKHRPLARVFAAIGIRGVGTTVAEALAQHLRSAVELQQASAEQLQTVPGLGPINAQNVVAFFANERNRRLIEKLQRAGVRMDQDAVAGTTIGPLSGKTFVITGTLPTWSREEATQAIEDAGGKVTETISRKTSYLLLGENPGSKYDKARKIGIPVIDEAELRRMLQQKPGQQREVQQLRSDT